jgi:hypothetical protein
VAVIEAPTLFLMLIFALAMAMVSTVFEADDE